MNVLPALLGESKAGRDHLIEHANGLAIRKGSWKLVPGKAKGGDELYDLATDLGETKNVAAQRPEIVKELSDLLAKVRDDGRSRK